MTFNYPERNLPEMMVRKKWWKCMDLCCRSARRPLLTAKSTTRQELRPVTGDK
jgi:hypothetical protein